MQSCQHGSSLTSKICNFPYFYGTKSIIFHISMVSNPYYFSYGTKCVLFFILFAPLNNLKMMWYVKFFKNMQHSSNWFTFLFTNGARWRLNVTPAQIECSSRKTLTNHSARCSLLSVQYKVVPNSIYLGSKWEKIRFYAKPPILTPYKIYQQYTPNS